MSGSLSNKFPNTHFRTVQQALSVTISTWLDLSHSTFGRIYIIFFINNIYYKEKNVIYYYMRTWVENYTSGNYFVISTQIQIPVKLQNLNGIYINIRQFFFRVLELVKCLKPKSLYWATATTETIIRNGWCVHGQWSDTTSLSAALHRASPFRDQVTSAWLMVWVFTISFTRSTGSNDRAGLGDFYKTLV